jgi:hypothetical protein
MGRPSPAVPVQPRIDPAPAVVSAPLIEVKDVILGPAADTKLGADERSAGALDAEPTITPAAPPQPPVAPPAPATPAKPHEKPGDFDDLNQKLDAMSEALNRFNDKLRERLAPKQ